MECLPSMSSDTGVRRMSPVNSQAVFLASMPDVPSNTCTQAGHKHVLLNIHRLAVLFFLDPVSSLNMHHFLDEIMLKYGDTPFQENDGRCSFSICCEELQPRLVVTTAVKALPATATFVPHLNHRLASNHLQNLATPLGPIR